MESKISPEQVERKIFRTSIHYGLGEFLIGCFFLYFAIVPQLSPYLGDFWSSTILIPLMGIAFTIALLLRKYVIIPRIGSVKFGNYRKKRLRKFTLIMLVLNIIAILVGSYAAVHFRPGTGWIHTGLVGLLALSFSSITAYFLDYFPIFIYGLLFLISLVSGEFLYIHYKVPHHGFPLTFSITGGIIILTGVIFFVRTLRVNPLSPENTTLEAPVQ